MSKISSQYFVALIVDSDAKSRMRIKAVTTEAAEFRSEIHTSTLEQGISKLGSGDKFDIVFVSERFGPKPVQEFIAKGKTLIGGQDAAYIMVVEAGLQDATSAATHVLVGADGILCAPYSVSQLVDITKLAARIKLERGQARSEAALRVIMREITGMIDAAAVLRGLGARVSSAFKKIKQKLDTVRGFPNFEKMYERVAVDTFESAAPPDPSFLARNYKGASQRIRKKLEDRLLAAFENPDDPAGLGAGAATIDSGAVSLQGSSTSASSSTSGPPSGGMPVPASAPSGSPAPTAPGTKAPGEGVPKK